MKNLFFWLVSGLSAAVWCVPTEFCGHKMAAKRPHGQCLLWWHRSSHLASRKTVAHSGNSTDNLPLRVLVWMCDQSCHWCPLAWASAQVTSLIQRDSYFHVNFDGGMAISVSGTYFQDGHGLVVQPGLWARMTKKRGYSAVSLRSLRFGILVREARVKVGPFCPGLMPSCSGVNWAPSARCNADTCQVDSIWPGSG